MGTDEKISAAVIDSTDRRLKAKISFLPQQERNSQWENLQERERMV
jgi:hypothetical protein